VAPVDRLWAASEEYGATWSPDGGLILYRDQSKPEGIYVVNPEGASMQVIRPGTAADAEGVARVLVATWQAAYAHVLPQEQLQALSVEERAEWHRARPPIVAEVDGEVVGFVSVGASRDEDADGELYAIYVHPDHWSTGAGRALMEAGEAELRRLGHRNVVLWVLEDNPRARRFYERAGWATDGAARGIEIFGAEVPEVRYRKDLN
jgi:ribosomal protein S18 acetylase RimI-like enzyme